MYTRVADDKDDVRAALQTSIIVTCATTTTVPAVLIMRLDPAPAVWTGIHTATVAAPA